MNKILDVKRKFLLILMLINTMISFAHEPIYGLGPETLPKHLHAIEIGTFIRQGRLEYELGYGYGITQNLTVRIDALINNNAATSIQGVKIKTKFALWRKMSPGVLKRLTAIAAVKLPSTTQYNSNKVMAYTLGLANGYESRKWYYFSDISYTYQQAKLGVQPGANLKYNLVGGIRPIKSDYLKPDLVLLVELNGEYRGVSRLNNVEIEKTNGNTLAVAPGFLFSYRNMMLKGGVQFGIAKTKNIKKFKPNAVVTLEYHF